MALVNKRGLSPVIATVLLISIAFVLAIIIFLWARTWVGEKIQKDLGGGPEAIESFCDDIEFVAEVERTGKININNLGNVPLYGLEVRRKISGSEEKIGAGFFDRGLANGASGSLNFNLGSINVGDEFIVIPIILGETGDYKKQHVCADEFAELAEVVA
ncbi:MAG: archaellin/type IV pilin N-terminal domain-containing protein [Patescibacteria group bacterium]